MFKDEPGGAGMPARPFHSVQSLMTTLGGVTLNAAVIEDSLVVNEKNPLVWKLNPFTARPVIDIGRDSEVKGDIVINRQVRLYVHDSARIGNVYGAQVIRYAGDRPK